MSNDRYAIVLPNGRPHFTDVTAREVEAICDELGYDRSHVLRKLRRQRRITLEDDVGKFEIIRQKTEAEALADAQFGWTDADGEHDPSECRDRAVRK